jgi:hypothetical protein
MIGIFRLGMLLVATGLMTATPASASEKACAALPSAKLGTSPEAATHIVSADIVAAQGSGQSLCRARGYVAPNTSFELMLPVSGWNGKFFYAGCTGSCGMAGESVWARECDYPLAKGYACIISDMGHRSTPADGLWAWRDLEAKVDFGFRATHRTTIVGKAIVEAFYGKPPEHSYFMGCSTGGRQGLVSAQRFPGDFDGIIAGAPVIQEGGTVMSFLWTLRSLAAPDGSSIFDEAALAVLHKGALAALDARDGRSDGVIDDPRLPFDPASLQCKAGQEGDCLTGDQVRAAQRIYAGPKNTKGDPLYFGGGFLPGSEKGWRAFMPIGGPAGAERSGVDTARYIQSDFGPEWRATDFDFDRDPDRLREMESYYSASNPDLRAYRDAGGKLLIYHGWADARVAPLNSVDYHQAVTRAMGGAEATRDFARLVMVPGMEHCWGGDGPFAIDYISAMEAWVERGEAPDTLRAARRKTIADPATGPSFIQHFPAGPGEEYGVRSLSTRGR